MTRKQQRVIRVSNKVSDEQFVKIIKDFEEQGYSVVVNATTKKSGYTELILK